MKWAKCSHATAQNSLELFVQRQGNLWRHVDEALTQQEPHRLAGVTEDLLQLFGHAVCRVLLTLIHDQLLHLLHTLHTLPEASGKSITCSFIVTTDLIRELIRMVVECKSYLSLCKVEHSDEAKHFIRVIIITVFWHFSLLERSDGTSEYILELKLPKKHPFKYGKEMRGQSDSP